MSVQTTLSQSDLGQTVLLAFRIAFVWAGGILLAVAVRALLPGRYGLTWTTPQSTFVIPFNRIGFWTCIWAAVTVTVLVVVRAMLGDFNGGPSR